MNGTDDPLVPWDGGDITVLGRTFGKVLSTPQTLAIWKKSNGCPRNPSVTEHWNEKHWDGTSVKRELFVNCKERVEVEMWTIEGGGHTWPGGKQYANEFFIGKTSREIDGNKKIWDFLKTKSIN